MWENKNNRNYNAFFDNTLTFTLLILYPTIPLKVEDTFYYIIPLKRLKSIEFLKLKRKDSSNKIHPFDYSFI